MLKHRSSRANNRQKRIFHDVVLAWQSKIYGPVFDKSHQWQHKCQCWLVNWFENERGIANGSLLSDVDTPDFNIDFLLNISRDHLFWPFSKFNYRFTPNFNKRNPICELLFKRIPRVHVVRVYFFDSCLFDNNDRESYFEVPRSLYRTWNVSA